MIGDFHQNYYIQQIEKLAYYRSYYKILGKHHVPYFRHKSFESAPEYTSIQSYYAKIISFEPDCQLQNELFDNNCALSMELCCLDRFIKTVNVSSFYDNGCGCVHQFNENVSEFHLHFSDSNLQNAATITAHLYTLLARMYEKKQMIRGGTMWD